jgi:hypothetical protein
MVLATAAMAAMVPATAGAIPGVTTGIGKIVAGAIVSMMTTTREKAARDQDKVPRRTDFEQRWMAQLSPRSARAHSFIARESALI